MALSWNFWHWSGVLPNTSKSIWLMLHLWCARTTTPWHTCWQHLTWMYQTPMGWSTCFLQIYWRISKRIGQCSGRCTQLSASVTWQRNSRISTRRSGNWHHRKRGGPHQPTPKSGMWSPKWRIASLCSFKLAPMHLTNWEEVQHEAVLLAACCKWMSMKKNITPQRTDALLKTCMGKHSISEVGKALFRVRNNLTIRKGLLYVNITPRGETYWMRDWPVIRQESSKHKER